MGKIINFGHFYGWLRILGNQGKDKAMDNLDTVEKMRHTLSHVLAAAVKELYPTTTFGVGPAIENGFYYDMDFHGEKVGEDDLKKIEKKMRGILSRGGKLVARSMPRAEAITWAKENGQNFKVELIEDLPDEPEISFYDIVAPDGTVVFTDMCKRPHVDDLKEIGAWKLERIAGAYWRGDEKREMLTRIYGLAFSTEDELKAYEAQQEEAKKRDHRKIGKELDLFAFSDLVGSGLPLFTPRGTILREMLNELAQGYRERCGYRKVCIPHIANVDLYKTSGHYQKFPELLKFISSESGDELALKPVNCPHHSQLFASAPRSYRELPVKYLETTMVYRDERKGELGGLSRVRAITQDDSHVFCTEEQVEGVFGELIESAKDLYKKVGMKLSLRLSFRDDGDGYIGDEKMWEKAQASIERMAKKFEMEYFIGVGEAAMYGPKMDFMAVDALGREWQLATVQLDYAMPARFGLEYTDADGTKKTPIMIHCALLGAIERFMSIFIEHTAGWFPMWCAPEAVRIVTIGDVAEYTEKVKEVLEGVVLNEPLKNNELRFGVDDSDESLGKKIRRAVGMKIPVILVIGEKDAEAGEVSWRTQDEEGKVKLGELGAWLKTRGEDLK